jgi:hypothetical protein
MPKHGKQILTEALKLPPVERAELVGGVGVKSLFLTLF